MKLGGCLFIGVLRLSSKYLKRALLRATSVVARVLRMFAYLSTTLRDLGSAPFSASMADSRSAFW